MKDNVYSDVRLRKFTSCYPYGGFDGWDIYREKRKYNEFKANKYRGIVNESSTFNSNLMDINLV